MAQNQPKDAYESEFKKDYQSDWDVHQGYVNNFDAWEAMLIGQVYDSVSNSVSGSKITDSYAATLAIERAARVMGKLPDGTTESVARGDQGKAAFMDLLRQKWIYPNANAQHDFETKLRLWQLYSSVYGYMPMFYDWNVSSTGYVGPDCWLWSPRNLIPQQGRTSIQDMEYVTALTWVSKKYLQGILDDLSEPDDGDENAAQQGGWDKEALTRLIELSEDRVQADPQKDTQVERSRIGQATKRGICLATRYEAGEEGEWCTFAPDHAFVEVRRLPNPHKNGRIPFVIKYSQPLFDSFYGLGDFQRAMPLQFARDGLTNFYFTGIKMNLIPPIVVNANGVLKHTIDYREGAVLEETIPNSIRRLETSNAGLATYQGAQQNLTGSLLSLFGSQNASIPGAEALNPSQGKTPAAISMYSDKEATRDGQERMYLESAIEDLTDGFNSLIVNIGTEDIPIALFSEDIKAIAKAGLQDIMGIFTQSSVASFQVNSTQTGGELKIDPTKLKGVEYRFNISTGSTARLNKDAQRQALENFVGVIGKLQNVLQNDPRVKVEWPAIMQAYEKLSGIDGVGDFISIDPNAQPQPTPEPPPKVNELINYKDAPPDIQAQLEEKAGLQPSPTHSQPQPQEPTVAANGMSFNDPHLAQVADALHKGVMQPTPPEPTVNPSGHSFMDPHVAGVAAAIHKLPTQIKAPPAEPKKPVAKKKGY